jgi:hypothetical protein
MKCATSENYYHLTLLKKRSHDYMTFDRDPCPGCQPGASIELRIPCGNYLRDEVNVCMWCGLVTPLGDGPPALMSWCAGHQELHRAANPSADMWKGWHPIEDVLPGGRLDGALEDIGATLGPPREPRTGPCRVCGIVLNLHTAEALKQCAERVTEDTP